MELTKGNSINVGGQKRSRPESLIEQFIQESNGGAILRQKEPYAMQIKSKLRLIEESFSGKDRATIGWVYAVLTWIKSDFSSGDKEIASWIGLTAKKSGVSYRTVQRCIKKLEKAGVIKKLLLYPGKKQGRGNKLVIEL
jgi:hypothetical protein